MYTFESKNCMDVFNGDLTEFLLGYGISIEHIDKNEKQNFGKQQKYLL